ncbi:hypothetical protein [Streptomyces fuscigenes]|uniref:hypothetical protein n=1 Tax=Streptomyces fuscigenes TaxID=1528880 RepID=UPI001F2D57B1|nr:hypothetical protein [Streptomyces fuscigenes]MCF3964603.1 hypothetical protein [Streptomyces fuscigenes]
MALSPRFALNTFGVLAGGFLAVSAMTFTAPVAGWLGFGVSTAVTVAALAGLVLARRPAAKAGHGVLAALGLWSLVASLVFGGGTLVWLVFAAGAAFVAAALADLTAHELSTERVVHALEVRPVDSAAGSAAAAPVHDIAA